MYLHISIDRQLLELRNGDAILRSYPISSASKGVGCQADSYRTPVGRFRIAEKIGADVAWGTVFQSRKPIGLWHTNHVTSDDLITSRILRLDGLEPTNANTYDRCIYIHGTNHESRIGEPCSHGCIRMRNDDVIDLFDIVPNDIEIIIESPNKLGGKIIFFDCDSTLSSIEGIDELARFCGPAIFREVEDLTNAAMNGKVPIHEVFPRRMDIIKPDKTACDAVAQMYIETIVPGVEETLKKLRESGWMIVIISGGFTNVIRPLADHLGIEHVEAVPIFFDTAGQYRGYGINYPTTRNGGKPEIIREWKQALLPSATVMVGDGMSDCETISEVDYFIGFGGVIAREKVKNTASIFVTSFQEILRHMTHF